MNAEPNAALYIRRFLGADEFINNVPRYCLWLEGIEPLELSKLSKVRQRIDAVRKYRLNSKRAATRQLADKSHLFGEIRQPQSGHYLLVPGVSSEHRLYLPIGFLSSDVIASNATLIIPDATIYDFAILTSAMHMAWVRYTCGRLESRYRYSANIVYNNFPWPELDDSKAKDQALRCEIKQAGQAVLDVRAKYQNAANPASLAILYDPDTMPADLRDAHAVLDALVDKAYLSGGSSAGKSRRSKLTDASRVALLFDRYLALTASLEHQEYSTDLDSVENTPESEDSNTM